MAALAGAANIIAIGGLADIVIRLGIEASGAFSRWRNASKAVYRLLNDLKTLTDLVYQIRVLADEYSQSLFASEDLESQLPHLDSSLHNIQSLLAEVRQCAEGCKSDTDDSWLKQWSKDMIWAIDENRVRGLCEKIEQGIVALNSSLSLIGRWVGLFYSQ